MNNRSGRLSSSPRALARSHSDRAAASIVVFSPHAQIGIGKKPKKKRSAPTERAPPPEKKKKEDGGEHQDGEILEDAMEEGAPADEDD